MITGSYNSDVASETSLAQMGIWIDQCHSFHRDCWSVGQRFMPRRLLHIECATGRTKVRLIEDHQGRHAYWAALSYVWGGDQRLKTTLGSIANMKAGFGVELLPQTLQDAVTVCRSLSLEYLWVDALCIIQDDPNDLVRELASMPLIYTEAWVTISASTATNVSEGFLQQRCYSHTGTPISLPYLAEDGLGTGEVVFVMDPCNVPIMRDEPINERAWTYQERRLSPRILDFKYNKVVLYCYTDKRCQGDGSSLSWSQSEMDQEYRLYRPCPSGHSLLGWHGIVDEYATRMLRFPSDKLLALSALADLHGRRTGHTYLAGLWKESLIEDLCWCNGSKKLLPRPTEYRAPSWSWSAIDISRPTSVDDHNIYHLVKNFSKNSRTEILESVVEQEPPDTTFGKIHAGFLKLQAPVLRAKWKYRGDGVAIMNLGGSISAKVFQDAKEVRWSDGELVQVLAVLVLQKKEPNEEEERLERRRKRELRSWQDYIDRRDVPLVKLKGKKTRGKVTHRGLMLVEDPPGTYRRIGLFEWRMNRDDGRHRRLYARFRVRRITIV